MDLKRFQSVLISFIILSGFALAEDVSLTLNMPGTVFLTGSPFSVDLELTNAGPDYFSAVCCVALTLNTGDYWFFPTWVKYPPDLSWELVDIPGFETCRMNIIPEFDWPSGTGEFFDAAFIAAVLSNTGALISNVPMVKFGWTSSPIVDIVEPASGPPGKILKVYGRGFALSSGNIKVNINGYQFPVISTGVESDGFDYVITVIPPLDSAQYEVSLLTGGIESNRVPFSIEETVPTGKPLGSIVDEISTGMNALCVGLNTQIIPDAVARGLIPSAAQSDYQFAIQRAGTIFNEFHAQIITLPDDQKAFIESVLVQNDLDDIFRGLTTTTKHALSMGDMTSFYACISLDTTSACLTVIDQAWSLVDLSAVIAAVLSGGAGLPAAGGSFGMHFAITILDNALDGFFPVDLKEIQLKNINGPLPAYVNQPLTYTIQGRFDNQKAPLEATFGIVLNSFLEGLGPFVPETFDDQLRNWVISQLSGLGLSLGDSIMGGSILNWGDPPPVTIAVDFELYEAIDFNQLLDMAAMFTSSMPLLNLFRTFNMDAIPSSGITIGNPSALAYQLKQDTITVTGQMPGDTSLTFNSFAFAVPDIWWNVLGLEFPEQIAHLQEVHITQPTPTPPPVEFVFIPAGSFQMGSPNDELCRTSFEGPVHQVTLTHGFTMQQSEVTESQWGRIFGLPGDRNIPIVMATWFEACHYCNLLSSSEGLTPCYYVDEAYTTLFTGTEGPIFWNRNAGGYRLPTEAEWEYTCRAGKNSAYNSGSDNTSCNDPDLNLDPLAWYVYNSGNNPHEIGLKEPNAWNLYDMHGNVDEWCWDWHSYDYYTSDPQVDPTGPLSGTYRIIRGGSNSSYPGACRSAFRSQRAPGSGVVDLGFRPARTLFE